MYLPPSVALTTTLARTPSGRAGVFYTLRAMRRLIEDWKTRPEILTAATSTIFLTPEKDELAELTALFGLVRDGVRYTRDVAGVETLASPWITLQRRSGDCDDKSVLFATLAEAVGYPTRLIMASYPGDSDYSHVHVQVLTDEGWIDADPTEPYPLGWAPPDAIRQFTERV